MILVAQPDNVTNRRFVWPCSLWRWRQVIGAFWQLGIGSRAYHDELVVLFQPPKDRLPSYSTIRRALLRLDYRQYSARLSRFFDIQPLPGETIATDGKVLRGSYEAISNDPSVDSHPAIMLVTAYIVERGLILEPYEVNSKTNEITALPAFIEQMALEGVVFAFDAISTQKNRTDHH